MAEHADDHSDLHRALDRARAALSAGDAPEAERAAKALAAIARAAEALAELEAAASLRREGSLDAIEDEHRADLERRIRNLVRRARREGYRAGAARPGDDAGDSA